MELVAESYLKATQENIKLTEQLLQAISALKIAKKTLSTHKALVDTGATFS